MLATVEILLNTSSNLLQDKYLQSKDSILTKTISLNGSQIIT